MLTKSATRIVIVALTVVSLAAFSLVPAARVAAAPESASIPLAVGQNLVSLPVVPANPDINSLLSGISGNVNSVWAYDAPSGFWQSWNPTLGGDLAIMVDGVDYYIDMSAPATLNISGEPLPVPPAGPIPAGNPGIPMRLQGGITLGGARGPEGLPISAVIGGVECAFANSDGAGMYGVFPNFNIPADDPATPAKDGGVNGDTVQMFVSGTLAGTTTFASGSIIPLNLVVGGAPVVAPSVTTLAATATGTDSATLNGNLASLGSGASADVSFDYGTTTAYGAATTPQTMTAGGAFNASLSGLQPDTIYHFRAKAFGVTNGIANGADMTFATGSLTPTTPTPVPTVNPGDESQSSTVTGRGEVSFYSSPNGAVTSDIAITSEDDVAMAQIDLGTAVTDANGRVISSITCFPPAAPAPVPTAVNVLSTCEFGPKGAKFDPAIAVTMKYDPAKIPAGVDESTLIMVYFDTATNQWVTLSDISVDTTNHTVSGMTTHFTEFAVIARATTPGVPQATASPAAPAPLIVPTLVAPASPAAPAPASTPTPAAPANPAPSPTTAKPAPVSTPSPTAATTAPASEGFNWWWVIGGAGFAVVVVIVFIMMRRRSPY